MEIEAKFVLPDAKSLQQLQALEHLAGFCLSAGQTLTLRDIYLDTAEQHILAAGYACRQRLQHNDILIILKELGNAQNAIHRRQEMQARLPSRGSTFAPILSIHNWPPSPVRERVQQIAGNAPLIPLVTLKQTRMIRPMSQSQRQVAELCLDKVCLLLGNHKHIYFELEVELSASGDEKDLTAIVNCLQDQWGLEPQTRSKFERALILLKEKGSTIC